MKIAARKDYYIIVLAIAGPLFGMLVLTSSDSDHTLVQQLWEHPVLAESIAAFLLIIGSIFLNRLFGGYEKIVIQNDTLIRIHNWFIFPLRSMDPIAYISNPRAVNNAEARTFWSLIGGSPFLTPKWARVHDHIPMLVTYQVLGFKREIGRDLEYFDGNVIVQALLNAGAQREGFLQSKNAESP